MWLTLTWLAPWHAAWAGDGACLCPCSSPRWPELALGVSGRAHSVTAHAAIGDAARSALCGSDCDCDCDFDHGCSCDSGQWLCL